ncbi:putative reverse transcriptase domain-containing protein [Tanacetum coccineum]
MPFELKNAPTGFMDLMNRVCKSYRDNFVILFIDDILIYSKSEEDHEVHLKLVLELLKKESLNGIHVDPSKIEVVKNWKAPKTPSKIWSFLGLAGYYRCFIANFSKIVKTLTSLTQKNKKYEWGVEEEEAFQTLKGKLLAAHNEATKEENAQPEMLCGLNKQMEKKEDEADKIALGTLLDMNTAYHPQIDGQSKHVIQTLEDMLREGVTDFGGSWDTHLPIVEFSYNNSYHSSIRCDPYEALYRRKCRPHVLWDEVEETRLIGPEVVWC